MRCQQLARPELLCYVGAMKNKTVLGLALLCVLLLVGLVLTFLRVSDLETTVADNETSRDITISHLINSMGDYYEELETTIADLEASTNQQITNLETSTEQQITGLETITSQLCLDISQRNENYITWDCEFSGQ
jgi:hypothetical protein